ncbi:unnamed protein product [Closterium sp. NIES-54]
MKIACFVSQQPDTVDAGEVGEGGVTTVGVGSGGADAGGAGSGGAEAGSAGAGSAGSGGAEAGSPLPIGHSLSAPPSDESVEPSGPKEHMDAAKRVLRYLCSTSGMGLELSSLVMQMLPGSSCEAEIYAEAMAAQELRWLTYLLTDLGEAPRSPPVMYVDNKAMLALCQEHRLEHRTKHIALRYFLARELQQRGQLRLAYVATQANTADIFTKALQPCDHQRFCTMLGFVHCIACSYSYHGAEGGGGVSISGSQQVLEAASKFFTNIFGRDRHEDFSDWDFPPSQKLDGKVAEVLTVEWSEQEVKRAFASMARNMSTGSDGLPKELFEAHWDLLGDNFMTMARDFEAPITLLNFTYKVLARVMADRMKSVLHLVISPEQYGFIPGRRLSDAVAMVADIIDTAKNHNEDWYLLLVDFHKEFDSISRDFLFDVLEKMGFPQRSVGWIKGLHQDTTTKLLINGSLGQGVDMVSGVRQGCPLAPYLFLCAVEPLALEVEKRKLGLEKEGRRLGYLGYVDDTTLVLQGRQHIAEAEEVLDKFEKAAGLATNKSKSVVLPLGANLNVIGGSTSDFKWAGADDTEHLLGVWVTPSGNGLPTWEKARGSGVHSAGGDMGGDFTSPAWFHIG